MTFRRALFTLLLLIIPLRSVHATDVVRFTIETIKVEGTVHASPRIIVAESRLREGQGYSESELRDATSRVDRLPFVLGSDLRLARGTAPGLYVLIITIHETKPLFISALSRSFWTESIRITGPSRPPAPPPQEEYLADFHNNEATVGGRWFTGSKGMAYVATDIVTNETYNNSTPHYDTLWRYHAGFTQYDLFGTRASLTAIVSYQNRKVRGIPLFDNDLDWKARDDLSYQLVAVAPIAANQSILASIELHTDPISYAGPPAHTVTLHTRPITLTRDNSRGATTRPTILCFRPPALS